MKVEVIPNRGPASMGPEINQGLHWATQIDLASAFVSKSALKRIRLALNNAKKENRSIKIRFLFGLYQRFVAPEALTEMLAIQRTFPGKFFVRIARNNRFHWKLYSFKKGSLRRLYVGSSNFTSDGLGADGELSLKVAAKSTDSIVETIEREFEEMWREDSLPLDKSLIGKYEKLTRPRQIFLTPQRDKSLTTLLRQPKRLAAPSVEPDPSKLRLVFVDDFISEETEEIIGEETNWYKRHWNTASFSYKRDTDQVKNSRAILLVSQWERGEYELCLSHYRGYVSLQTPDGNHHIAHSHIPFSWRRKYSVIKKELAEVGLTVRKIKSDRNLNRSQIALICRLLHIDSGRLGAKN